MLTVPNVLSPRDLVSRSDNVDKKVLHTLSVYSLSVILITTGSCAI